MKDDLEENLGKEYIDDNENVISTKSKEDKEENKNSEKIEILYISRSYYTSNRKCIFFWKKK